MPVIDVGGNEALSTEGAGAKDTAITQLETRGDGVGKTSKGSHSSARLAIDSGKLIDGPSSDIMLW